MWTTFNVFPAMLRGRRGTRCFLIHSRRWLAIGYVLAAAIFTTTIAARELPFPPHKKPASAVAPSQPLKRTTPPATTPALVPAATPVTIPIPEAAPVPQTPAQMPPKSPQVWYEGGQLTIIAENSTLGDILAAVQKLTGVQTDLPAGAAGERMVARLGPGRPREVLASLLSWTDFNYVIQAADDDPEEVQSILLIARSKTAPKTGNSGTMAARLQRYGNRGRVEPAPSATEETTADQATPESSQPADTAEASPVSTPPAAAVDPQSAPATQADLKPVPAASESDVNQASVSPAQQRMQDMQRLYEQRRQMMQQQNQRPPATN